MLVEVQVNLPLAVLTFMAVCKESQKLGENPSWKAGLQFFPKYVGSR
jgi:hypothetical protein